MKNSRKTMRITLTEDFLVPTDDGNIIFEPGDEIEVEYEDDELEAPAEEAPYVEDDIAGYEPASDLADDDIIAGIESNPLTFAANPEFDSEESEDQEVYIEDPMTDFEY